MNEHDENENRKSGSRKDLILGRDEKGVELGFGSASLIFFFGLI